MRSAINWYKRYLGWFGKHKIITAILVVIIAIAAISSGSETSKKSTATKSTVKTSASPAKKTKKSPIKESPKRQTKGVAVTIGAGTFSGGKEVSVGLYDVTPGAGQSGNFIVNGSNSYNEILGNAGAAGGVSKVRVQISSGDKIEISGLSAVTFTPVTTPFSTTHTTTSLYAGTFVVGQDIGAGRYVATPGAGQSGNFIVNGTNSYNEILGGDSNYGGVPNVSVTLSDGDVIHISGLSEVTLTVQ